MNSSPSLTAGPSEVIKWCIKKIRPTRFFTGRLGLPQTKHNEGDRSQIEFSGDAALDCKALYDEWRQARRDMLEAHFKWKDDLREKAVSEFKDLSFRYISPLLDRYGPTLWPESHDVHAGESIDSDHYPRRLVYTSKLDRER
jgi:hypothetical protein